MLKQFGKIVATTTSFFVVSSAVALSDYVPYDKENRDALGEEYKLSRIAAQVIRVKFKDEFSFRLRGDKIKAMNNSVFSPELRSGMGDLNKAATELNKIIKDQRLIIVPTFSEPNDLEAEQKLAEEQNQRMARTGKKLADLNNYFTLVTEKVSDLATLGKICDLINQIDAVEIAEAESVNENIHALPVMPQKNPDYNQPPTSTQLGWQGYLLNSVNGIHAIDGWKWKGGTGEFITAMAVDGNINPDHIDLVHKPWFGSWWASVSNYSESNHGTAVSGILFAGDNNFGITGIVHDVTVWGFESARRCFIRCWLDAAYALNRARPKLSPGDILSMSVGTTGPNGNGVPAEWSSATFSATQALTADGIVVLVSASNTGIDLDDPVYLGNFDLNVRDSGAIIVGGTWPYEQDGRWGNYGSRITAHSWGNWVSTLGYDPDGAAGGFWDEKFTNRFSGTSAATPIVAGAAASIQSIRKGMGLPPLTSVEMRDLISATGTPQTYNTVENIGVTPNVHAAALDMQSTIISCYQSVTPTISSSSAYYPNIHITNISGQTLSNWTAYIDLDSAQSISVSSSPNVTAAVKEDFVLMHGASPLAPGATESLTIYASYSHYRPPSGDCF